MDRPGPPEADEQARELVARGDRSLDGGEPAAALDAYEGALAADPGDGEAAAGVALALTELNRKDEALDRLRRGAAERGEDAHHLVWLGRAMAVLGSVDEALELARRVTEEMAPAWRDDGGAAELARLWLDVGDPARGLQVLDTTSADVRASPHARAARGRLLAELGRHEEAVVEYDAALGMNAPREDGTGQDAAQDAQTLLDSSVSLATLGRSEEALARARRAAEQGGLNIWGHLALVDVLSAVGAREDAAALLRTLAQGQTWRGSRVAAATLADRLVAHDLEPLALPVLDTILADAHWAASDEATPSLLLRAALLASTGEPARAVADFTALADRGAPVEQPGLRFLAGTAFLAVAQPETALDYLVGLADQVTEEQRVWVLVATGIALVSVGNGPAAVAPLRDARALAAAPGGDSAAAGTAALFLALALGEEDRPMQRQLLGEADSLLPPDSPHRPLLGLKGVELALSDRRTEHALALSDDLAERVDPRDRSTALLLRARALAQAGRWREAREALDAAVDGEPGSPGPIRGAALVWRGVVHGATGDHERAREDLLQALELVADVQQRRELRVMVAAAEARLGTYAAALATLDELAADDADAVRSAAYWELRAEVLVTLDRFAEAVEAADRLAELNPAKRRLAQFLRLGMIGLSLDWSSFADTLVDLQASPPEGAGALDWLVTAYARALTGTDDAAGALERAAALDPPARDSALGRQVRMLIAAQQGDVAAFDAVGPPPTGQDAREEILWHMFRAKALLAQEGNERAAIAELAAVARLAAREPTRLTDPQAVVCLARVAQLHLTMGETGAAGVALAEADGFLARIEDPGALGPTLALARALWRMAEEGPGRALEELEPADAALQRLPDDLRAVVAYVRGTLLRRVGDDERALAELRKAATLDPSEPSLLRALVAVQIDLRDDSAALETIGQARALPAVRAEPRRLADLDRLTSIALRRLGRLEGSLEHARDALALDWTDPVSWLALGDAYEALDRPDQAATAYRRGWELTPGDDAVAARCLVGLTRALLLGGKDAAALDVLGDERRRSHIAHLAVVYGAIPYNRAVAQLRTGDEEGARRSLGQAAEAVHPVPESARLAAGLARQRARDGTWVGYWFRDRESRVKKVVGAGLLVALVLAIVVAMADPTQVRWLRWVSAEGGGRLAPLLVVAGLLLLPVITKLKLGAVEIEQPRVEPVAMPDLEPMSIAEAIAEATAEITAVVTRATAALTARTGTVAIDAEALGAVPGGEVALTRGATMAPVLTPSG